MINIIKKELYNFGTLKDEKNYKNDNFNFILFQKNLFSFNLNTTKYSLLFESDEDLIYYKISYKLNIVLILLWDINFNLIIINPLNNFFAKYEINIKKFNKLIFDFNTDYLILLFIDNKKNNFYIIDINEENKLIFNEKKNYNDEIIDLFILENNKIIIVFPYLIELYNIYNNYLKKELHFEINSKILKAHINLLNLNIYILTENKLFTILNFNGEIIKKYPVDIVNFFIDKFGFIFLDGKSNLVFNNFIYNKNNLNLHQILIEKTVPKIKGDLIKYYNFNYNNHSTIINIVPNITLIFDNKLELMDYLIDNTIYKIIKFKPIDEDILLLYDSFDILYIYKENRIIKQILFPLIFSNNNIQNDFKINDFEMNYKKNELVLGLNNGFILIFNILENKLIQFKKLSKYSILKIKFNKSFNYLIIFDSDGIKLFNNYTYIFNCSYKIYYSKLDDLDRIFYLLTNNFLRSNNSLTHKVAKEDDFIILTAIDNQNWIFLNFYRKLNLIKQNQFFIWKILKIKDLIRYYDIKEEVPYFLVITEKNKIKIFDLENFEIKNILNIEEKFSKFFYSVDLWFLYLICFNKETNIISLYELGTNKVFNFNLDYNFLNIRLLKISFLSNFIYILDEKNWRFFKINKQIWNAYNKINLNTKGNNKLWSNFEITKKY